MSWYADVPHSEYRRVPGLPSPVPPSRWFSSAKKPAHCGDAPDVPPTAYHAPFWMT
jgi:hypothetical protein